jgi:hypothetical protein
VQHALDEEFAHHGGFEIVYTMLALMFGSKAWFKLKVFFGAFACLRANPAVCDRRSATTISLAGLFGSVVAVDACRYATLSDSAAHTYLHGHHAIGP